MKGLAAKLNQLSDKLYFDHREMEIFREQLEQLVKSNPRRPAAEKKKRLVAQLGAKSRNAQRDRNDTLAETAVIGFYALAHTAVQRELSRSDLATEFDTLINDQKLAKEYKKSLTNSPQKVGKYYDSTRAKFA